MATNILATGEPRAGAAVERAGAVPDSSAGVLRILLLLFFLSGTSSLIFETIFTRLLTYTFGNTAYAVSTVLAAFLGGLALGAILAGRWVDRRAPSLWIYGTLELLVAVYCVFIPRLFAVMTQIYLGLYHRMQLGAAGLTALRFALAALVILLPSMLMGGSLPALARYVAAVFENFELEVDRLYAWNTLGAATGTLASTFLLMPVWGITGALGIGCGINFAVFGAVVLLSRRAPATSAAEAAPRVALRDPAPGKARGRGMAAILLAGAFLTGAVALGYEVLWTHALSFTVGNSVYAFGVMLFVMLCGLGWGARIVSEYFDRPETWARALAASQIGLGIVILATVPFWDRMPAFFSLGLGRVAPICLGLLVALRITVVALKNRHRPAQRRTLGWLRKNEPLIDVALFALAVAVNYLWDYPALQFVAGEMVRFCCSFFLLIVPALLMGLSFPLLLNLYGQEASREGGNVGGIYGANTLGGIFGSVVTGFFLLARFGSLASLRIAAAANVALGIGLALCLLPLEQRRKMMLAFGAMALTAILWLAPGNWNTRRMARGSYVYFGVGYLPDRVLYSREDVQSGLTSVVQIGGSHILLSNGKFQGNNTGEVQAQTRFALVPILFTHNFDRALVIGLGTGSTLRTVASFPFKRLDAAELAPSIVDAARLWFGDINGDVFDRDPRVHLSVADGRNYLLLSQEKYDLITVEITSIWISGEADLYNQEFYELCREHLREDGVLQQWVQIHHMPTRDLLILLNTAAQVFPHMAFFQGPEQGLLIASASPLEPDYREIEALEKSPPVRGELNSAGLPSLWSLLGEMMLYGDSFHAALAQLPALSGKPAYFASTDYHPYLEYQTPKGNLLSYSTVILNLAFLAQYRAKTLPPDMAIRNLPSAGGRDSIMQYVSKQRVDAPSASNDFDRAHGQSMTHAQPQASRLAAQAR
jgi:spermidine synthase